MRKVWEWLKKNWKYLLFPLWILSLILVWVLSGGKAKPPLSGTSDQAADSALKAKDDAIQQLRERDAQIAQQLEEKLRNASKEQIEELKKMKDKPLDEVAKWVDSIQ